MMGGFTMLGVFLMMVVALLASVGEATPPGIAKNPSKATCKIKKYKYCYNLEHVCPKFCPDSCTVHCASCKPICGVAPEPTPSDDQSPPSPESDPTPSTPDQNPPPLPSPSIPYFSPPPPLVPSTPSTPEHNPPPSPSIPSTPSTPDQNPPPSSPTPSTPDHNPSPSVPSTPSTPDQNPPPPSPTPSTPDHNPSPSVPSTPSTPDHNPPPSPSIPSTPSTPDQNPPPPSPTPSTPDHNPSPSVPSTPSTPDHNPPPSPSIPSTPSTPDQNPPPSSPTPSTPDHNPSPSVPSTPSTPDHNPPPPSPTPSTPDFNPSPSVPSTPSTPDHNPPPSPSIPSTPSTPDQNPPPPSPTPSTPDHTPSPSVPSTPSTPDQNPPPSSPTPSTPDHNPSPSPSTPSSPSKARCWDKGYPTCYNTEHVCPKACPRGCEVDCKTCKPICKCDQPGAVCQDPRFIGADGVTFYFHGKKDSNFCLVSDPNLHINAHFIGKTNPNMTRDFTWVQSIAILFHNHQIFLGAQKTSTWDDSIDRLALAFDGQSIALPQSEGATWSSDTAPRVLITRAAESNNVVVEIDGNLRITAKVVPITEEDSRIHNYGITQEDCFAHLDLGFKFLSLSDKVSGVLGQTYRPDYVSRVNIKAKMPVMGGDREFATTSLFAPDCSVSRFVGKNDDNEEERSMEVLELPSMKCASGIGGQGVVCKR